MKQRHFFMVSALIVSLISFFTLTSCDKDTECKLRVTVMQTGKPVAGAFVSVIPSRGEIFEQGYADANGVFECSFDAPAIFNIYASDTIMDYEYTEYTTTETDPLTGIVSTVTVRDSAYTSIGCYAGHESVRLKDGETVHKTVTLADYTEF